MGNAFHTPDSPRCRKASRVYLRGFSLIELVVAMAVLAILAAAAMPSLIEIVNRNRLASRSNDVLAMLQSSRLESVRRGVRVVVCPSSNATSCVSSATWAGWIAFADADGDNTLDAGESLLSELMPAPTTMIASSNISSGTGRIVFRPDGLAYRANGTTLLSGNLSVCHATNQPAENVRDISIVGSRMSIARRNGSGACAAPANP